MRTALKSQSKLILSPLSLIGSLPIWTAGNLTHSLRAPQGLPTGASARSYYERLVTLAGNADTTRPDLIAAKQYLTGK
jgi:hypothetical protein